MFKIKINDLNRDNIVRDSLEPYQIRFELVPEFCETLRKTIYHETNFSSIKQAQEFTRLLSQFFEDSFFFVDLIYHRINSLGVYNHTLKIEQKTYHDYYVKLQKNRGFVLSLNEPAYCYEIFTAIQNYINSLIGIIFFYKDTFKAEANKIYHLLEQFKGYFIRNVRASRELYNNDNLVMLW